MIQRKDCWRRCWQVEAASYWNDLAWTSLKTHGQALFISILHLCASTYEEVGDSPQPNDS